MLLGTVAAITVLLAQILVGEYRDVPLVGDKIKPGSMKAAQEQLGTLIKDDILESERFFESLRDTLSGQSISQYPYRNKG